MNYRKLVRVVGSKKATPTPAELLNEKAVKAAADAARVPIDMISGSITPQPVVVEKVIEKEVIDQETKDILMSIQDSLSNRAESAPEWMNHTTLTDEECAEVQSFLMGIKKDYFPDMELSPTIPKMFIWNIPRPVYEVFKHMKDNGETEQLNPLFWFFMCCVDLTPEMFCEILKHALDNFTTGEYDRIKQYIDTDEEDESDEDDSDGAVDIDEYEAMEMDPNDIDIDEDIDVPPEDINDDYE